MNRKTTSAKLMSIILIVVMLVGMMPASIAMAEDETPIYSCEVEDIDLYLPASYTQSDIYDLSKTALHDGKDLRVIKVKNTGNQKIQIYNKPTLTDKSENFDDKKIWVQLINGGGNNTVKPGDTGSRYYMEISEGLESGVYTATINFAGNKDYTDEVGTVTATAKFTLTVGDHHYGTEWESDSKEHWHACTDTGCTAKKDVAAHNSDKVVGATAATFDDDGSTGTKYCSVCDTKMAEAKPIPAGKYIRESKATMTPAAITDAMCANDLTFASLEPTKYTVALYSGRVFDLTESSLNTDKEGGASSGTYPLNKKFIAGHQYSIEFEFEAVTPYVYNQTDPNYDSTFTLNGEPADMSKVTSLAGGVHRRVVLTATASGTTPTPSHSHVWAEAWSKNETHHWHDCTADDCTVTENSGKDGYDVHKYDQEVATADYLASAATCQAKATYYKSCICGAKGTDTFESGDKAAHDFSGEYYKDATGHGKTCITTGCTAHDVLTSHVYDNDKDTTCNTCGYVRTIAPTPTQVSGAKFAMSGYAIGSKIVNTTVTPDSSNTGINYGGEEHNHYRGYYMICTDAKALEGDSSSAVGILSDEVFKKDTTYYLAVSFMPDDGYSINDLTAAQVTLDGVGAASKLLTVSSDGVVTAATAIFTLPKLTETSTATLYDVYIAGEQFTSKKLTISCGDGTAAFDPATNTLTLTNATITSTDANPGIKVGDGISKLTINLVGQSNISNTTAPGIFAMKNIVITDPRDYSTTEPDTYASLIIKPSNIAEGITVRGDMTVDNWARVGIDGNKAQGAGVGFGNTLTVQRYGYLRVLSYNDAIYSTTSGNIVIDGNSGDTNDNSYIYAYSSCGEAIDTNGTITVKNGGWLSAYGDAPTKYSAFNAEESWIYAELSYKEENYTKAILPTTITMPAEGYRLDHAMGSDVSGVYNLLEKENPMAELNKYPGVEFHIVKADAEHQHYWYTYDYNDTHHWKKCMAVDCPVTENSDKYGYGAHVYTDDTDTTCNTCGYVREIVSTPTQVSGAKFAINGYTIGGKIVDITVTPDSTNTGINHGDDTNNKYDGYYVIHTDSKVLDGNSASVVVAGSDAVFEKDKNYYLVIYIYANSGYSVADLTKEQVTLDGVAASKLVRNASQPGVAVTAIFTLPKLTETPTPGHTHIWAEAWSKDSTHHWHNCTATGCDVTANSAKDGYDVHKYDQEVATADYLATSATCQAKATYYKSCICGAKGTDTFESGDKAAHDFSGEYYKDATGHGKTCVTTGCTAHDVLTSHVYDNNADTTCNTCGYVRTIAPTPASYTITFDANKGTVSPSTATTDADGKLATLPEPTRSKYKFVGWFTDKTGGEQVTTSTVFTDNTTVYAQWKLRSTGGGGGSIVYKTLTFETDGGSHLDSITRTQGTTVSLNAYQPTKSGYAFTGWYSDKKLTKKITTVQLDQDITVYAAWQQNTLEPVQTEPFVDVNVNDWFYGDVVYAYNNGLMGGMSANIFGPNVPTTRGMIVTILYRMENEPAIDGIMPFKDVKAGSYYERAILWAVSNNIVSGYGNDMFGPDDMITREQMASILWRYAQYKGYDVSIGENTNILSYDDALSISAYAMPALQWACGDGIIGGTTANTLSPQGQATRAQTVAILHRFCDKIGR